MPASQAGRRRFDPGLPLQILKDQQQQLPTSLLVPLHFCLVPKPNWQSNPTRSLGSFPVAHTHSKNSPVATVPPKPRSFEALFLDPHDVKPVFGGPGSKSRTDAQNKYQNPTREP